MISRIALLATAACLILSHGAQAQSVPCDQAQTQTDMNICADLDYKKADKRLNNAYKALMGSIDGEVKQLTREAQRAWITFRDKECLAQAGGERSQTSGSMWPLLYSSCLAELTNQRAEQLEQRER